MIHFGHYLRAKRVAKGWTIRKFSAESKVTEPRLIAYEKMPTPVMYESTFGRLALALGMEPGDLDRAWRTTEVEPPEERARKLPRFVRFELPETDFALLAAYAEGVGASPSDAARALMLESLQAKQDAVRALGEVTSRGATSSTEPISPGSSRLPSSRTEDAEDDAGPLRAPPAPGTPASRAKKRSA